MEEVLKHRNDLKKLFERQRKKVHRHKKHAAKPPTVAMSPALLQRQSKLRQTKFTESSEEKSEREIHAAQQQLASQIEQNRRYHAANILRASNAGSTIHSTKPLTIPMTPTFMQRVAKTDSQTHLSFETSSHISQADCNGFYKNLRAELSKELAQAKLDAQKRPKVTVPEAPSFASDARAAAYSATHPRPLTMEEKELKIIAEEQFRARKFNRDVVLNGAGSSGVAKVKSRPSTITEPFKISTTKSEGRNNALKAELTSQSQIDKAMGFKARPMPTQRQSTSGIFKAGNARKSLTIPKSPTLSTTNRRHTMTVLTESVDDNMAAFRARPMPNFNVSRVSGVKPTKQRELTVPQSPRISKSNRSHSTTNDDETEYSNMTFHARPMPDFNNPSGGSISSRIEKRELTVPQSPRISKTNRNKSLSVNDENSINCSNFSARPMPDYTTLGQCNKHVVKTRPLTVPRPPALSVSNRNVAIISSTEDKEAAETQNQFKARPAPSFGSIGGGHIGISMVHRRPLTEPKPFSFPGDTHHEKAQTRIEELRKKKEEDEQRPRDFTAMPMPYSQSATFIPRHSERKLTEFKEFDISDSDIFHAKKREWAARKASEDALSKSLQRDFRAMPLPQSTYEPDMIPQPSDRPPVVPDDVHAYNPPRAIERRAYDEANKKRIEEENRIREAVVKEREKLAEDEYLKLMKTPIADGGLRFIARDAPATTFGSPDFIPLPSDAPLTEPCTPIVLKRPTHITNRGLSAGPVRIEQQ